MAVRISTASLAAAVANEGGGIIAATGMVLLSCAEKLEKLEVN